MVTNANKKLIKKILLGLAVYFVVGFISQLIVFNEIYCGAGCTDSNIHFKAMDFIKTSSFWRELLTWPKDLVNFVRTY